MKKIRSISIIDDDELFQFSLKKILTATEVIEDVLQFPNGEKALDYFIENGEHSEKLPDIIFLDLNMPKMNGWEFLERFASTAHAKKEITIYICTASEDHTDRERYKEFNKLAGFLVKPLNKFKVYDVLDRELTTHYPFTLN